MQFLRGCRLSASTGRFYIGPEGPLRANGAEKNSPEEKTLKNSPKIVKQRSGIDFPIFKSSIFTFVSQSNFQIAKWPLRYIKHSNTKPRVNQHKYIKKPRTNQHTHRITNFWTLGNTTMETIEAKALKNLGNIARKLSICENTYKFIF